jgi:hypothetical protein
MFLFDPRAKQSSRFATHEATASVQQVTSPSVGIKEY